MIASLGSGQGEAGDQKEGTGHKKKKKNVV